MLRRPSPSTRSHERDSIDASVTRPLPAILTCTVRRPASLRMLLHALEIAELQLRIARARNAADRDRVARTEVIARWFGDRRGGGRRARQRERGGAKRPCAVYCRPRGWWPRPLVRKGFSCLSDCFRRRAVTDRRRGARGAGGAGGAATRLVPLAPLALSAPLAPLVLDCLTVDPPKTVSVELSGRQQVRRRTPLNRTGPCQFGFSLSRQPS